MTNDEIAIVSQMRAWLLERQHYIDWTLKDALAYLDTLTSKRWRVVEAGLPSVMNTEQQFYNTGGFAEMKTELTICVYGQDAFKLSPGTRVLIVVEEEK